MANNEKIEVVVFSQTGCAYCVQMISYLNTLIREQSIPLEITEYDIRQEPKYYELFSAYGRAYGIYADSTPITYIGEKVIRGYLPNEVNSTIENCQIKGCPSPQSIVAAYEKNNPTTEQQEAKDKMLVGWVVIVVVVVGGGILFLSKN